MNTVIPLRRVSVAFCSVSYPVFRVVPGASYVLSCHATMRSLSGMLFLIT